MPACAGKPEPEAEAGAGERGIGGEPNGAATDPLPGTANQRRVSRGGGSAQAARNAAVDRFPELESLPRGQSQKVFTVRSGEELQALYDKLADGGTPLSVSDYKGRWVQLPDGWWVGLRERSESGGPTIDIRSPEGRTVKVHIQP